MNIIIVGQGAMGLLWHYHLQALADNSSTITLLPSPKMSRPLSQQAATYNTPTYQQYSYTHLQGLSEQCYYQVAQEQQLNQADIVLLCVKSYQVKNVLADIGTKLNKDAIIILAHNGMGTLTDIKHGALHQHTILALLTTHGCARPMPKHIIHTGSGNSDLGLLSGNITNTSIENITSFFQQALPNVQWRNNIIEKQWRKLAVNCVINPLTALYNINNGEINSTKFTDIKTALINEVVQVASTEQYQLNQEELIRLVNQVAIATAKNCSSMRADILAKRKTEIDYINGYIHRLGLKHHIATPENTKLWQQIHHITCKKLST
jgi:2-dehydropantoate 2-reductase